MSNSEVHDYIRSVIEKSDHGPDRLIEFDAAELNKAIEINAAGIAKIIQEDTNNLEVLPVHDEAGRGKVDVHNYLGNIRFKATVVVPNNLQEIMEVLVLAKQENQNVRAVGAFHAWSHVCETPGYLLKTDNLVGTTRTPADTLKNPAATAYYDVLCGTSWKQAAVALKKERRAFINLSGYSGLHVIGSTSTGTHGSGLKIPPLAGMICGVTLVSAKFGSDGLPTLYRIEPTDGITDPKKYSGPAVLLQDDETFNAVIVGLCAFGIVYSVTFKTVPFYLVRQTRELVDWTAAKQLLLQGPDGDILKYQNAEVWLNPYLTKNKNSAIITRREMVEDNGQPLESNVSPFASLVENLPAFKTVLKEMGLNEEGDGVISRKFGEQLGRFFKKFPFLVPCGIDITLKTQLIKSSKDGNYYDIYDIGFANYFPAISNEISFPMSTYIGAAESAMKSLQSMRRYITLNSKALVGFLSLRFTSGIAANLSMSYDPNPASLGRNYLEIYSLFNFYDSISGFDELVAPIQEESIKTFKGRLHWGQYLNPQFTALKYKEKDPEYYASISAWKKISQKFDPDRLMWSEFMETTIFSKV